MIDILFNSFIFIVIIIIGYLLKKTGLLKKEVSDVLAFIIMNFTLPAALINGSADISISPELVIFIILGFAVNIIMTIISALVFKKRDPLTQGVYMLCTTGIDAGNGVLPYIQTFLPGPGVIALCAFNIGNTVMNCGFNYLSAIRVSSRGEKMGMKEMAKKLFTNVLFDTYIVIFIMACLPFGWPGRFLQITSVIGDANIFLVFLMIGLKMEFDFDKKDVREYSKLLSVRVTAGIIMTLVTWMLPISTVGKIACTCTYFGPPAAVANIFAPKLGYKGSYPAQMYVICTFTSMIIITALLMCFS